VENKSIKRVEKPFRECFSHMNPEQFLADVLPELNLKPFFFLLTVISREPSLSKVAENLLFFYNMHRALYLWAI